MSSPNPPVFLEHKLDKLYESNVYEPEYVVNITEDEENGNLSLQVGQTFETFEEVEAFLAQYCEQNGFEYRKRRVEYDDNNIIRKRTYECTKASQYQPKKDKDPEKHRNQSSGSIGCQWHLNVTCLKSTNITIRITKVVDEHNHPLSSNIKIHGPQFRQFSKEMKSDILEYLSAVPTMGARTLYGLLKVKRSARLQEKDDAQNMLQELYDLQRKEPGWIIETLLKKFLTPNLLNIAKKEILESILYEATCMDLNLIDTLDVEYLFENDSIESKFAAFFNISLIPSRWYGDQVAQFSEDEIRTSPLIQLCNVQNKSIQTSIQTDFLYLSDIYGGNVFTPILKEVVSKRQQYAKAYELQKKAYNFATRIGQESEYINLLKNFIHTMEISLEEVANEKENSVENQKITNPIYIKPRIALSETSVHGNYSLSGDQGNVLANSKHSLSDENYESNNYKRMKKCGRYKQYAMHNRRICNVDLGNSL
ncbi:15069_t:CDS:2 [Rhizophagus irregularis]|nr:15069_t:CDS:2 [Rhizophagus irregularis]